MLQSTSARSIEYLKSPTACLLIAIATSLWQQHRWSHSSSPSIGQEIWIQWLAWTFILIASESLGRKQQQEWTDDKSNQDEHELEQTSKWSCMRMPRPAVLCVAATAVVSQHLQSMQPLAYFLPFVTLSVQLISEPVDEGDVIIGEGKTGTIRLKTDQDIRLPTFCFSECLPQLVQVLLPCSLAVGLFFLFDIGRTFTPLALGLSAAYFLTRATTYTLLSHLNCQAVRSRSDLVSSPDSRVLGEIAQVAFFYLSVTLLVIRPTPSLPLMTFYGCAFAQSAWWLSVFGLVMSNVPVAAPNVDTIATVVQLITVSSSPGMVLGAASCTLAALWQSLSSTSFSSRIRFLLCGVTVLSTIVCSAYSGYATALTRSPAIEAAFVAHPLETNINHARQEFQNLLSAQSTCVMEVREEYERRYQMQPPPYFDEWFELAQQHNFLLIDEFDGMMQMFEPFFKADPTDLQTTVDASLKLRWNQLARVDIACGDVSVTQGARSAWHGEMLGLFDHIEWLDLLGEVTLAVNTHNIPLSSVPSDDKLVRPDCGLGHQEPNFDEHMESRTRTSWNLASSACPIDSPARNGACRESLSISPEFVANIAESRDICQQCRAQCRSPAESLFLHRDDRWSYSLIPVWSQSKTSAYNDLLFPSPHDMERARGYSECADMAWHEKDDNLFLGHPSPTATRETGRGWYRAQSRRLKQLFAAESTKDVKFLRKAVNGYWQPYTAQASAMLTELNSTQVVNDEIEDAMSAAYQHKFVMDIDGNGSPGQFVRLLSSNSMVIKQSLLKEWHNDRVLPWIHYAPVSTDMEELPEMMHYLTQTPEGEKYAYDMASFSKLWAGQALRDVDMQLWFLRALLEYSRIVDPERTV